MEKRRRDYANLIKNTSTAFIENQSHKDLDIWKLGINFVESIYKYTKYFPKEELYALTSQLKRSAITVPSNIAEGYTGAGNKELIRFLYNALGALSECETQIIISIKPGYFPDDMIPGDVEIIKRKLLSPIKY